MAHLYYGEPSRLINTHRLRELAAREVTVSKLITLAASGDLRAAIALLRYFWPFVWAFEKIIDRTKIPRRPLMGLYGKELVAMFRTIAKHLDDMAKEEGVHSQVWARDARDLGLELDAVDYSEFEKIVSDAVAGVRKLIESAITSDMVFYFAVLAATEFIAEELSRRLNRTNAPAFAALFSSEFFRWGEVHLRQHEGPSHLDLDLNFALAFSDGTDEALIKSRIEDGVEKIIRLFGEAAEDVYAQEFEEELMAAE